MALKSSGVKLACLAAVQCARPLSAPGSCMPRCSVNVSASAHCTARKVAGKWAGGQRTASSTYEEVDLVMQRLVSTTDARTSCHVQGQSGTAQHDAQD